MYVFHVYVIPDDSNRDGEAVEDQCRLHMPHRGSDCIKIKKKIAEVGSRELEAITDSNWWYPWPFFWFLRAKMRNNDEEDSDSKSGSDSDGEEKNSSG